jgi:hypothetical protein
MKKIEFASLKETVEYAKKWGGWIFHSKENNISIWYDAAVYTISVILKDSPTDGRIDTWTYFENVLKEEEKINKQLENKFNELVSLAISLDYDINLNDTKEKFNNILNSRGKEEAEKALNETIKTFKSKVKESNKKKWNDIKNELFQKKGCAPTSIRVLKSMIKNGEIDVNLFNNKEWIIKELNILQTA